MTVSVWIGIDPCHGSKSFGPTIIVWSKRILSFYQTIIVWRIEPARSVCVGFWSTMARLKPLYELDLLGVFVLNDGDLCHWVKIVWKNDKRSASRLQTENRAAN